MEIWRFLFVDAIDTSPFSRSDDDSTQSIPEMSREIAEYLSLIAILTSFIITFLACKKLDNKSKSDLVGLFSIKQCIINWLGCN